MPGPAGQELKARRRRSAAFLLGSDKEAAEAPVGAAAAAKQSGSQPQAEAAKPVPVVQAESVPDREPGCCRQLLEYIGYGSAENSPSGFSVDANASFKLMFTAS